MAAAKPRVLCVDDETNVLEGLLLSLRRGYQVVTAPSGAEGLKILEADPTIATVISDMRMPHMDGAAFLTKAHAALPDATRLLLTGQADVDAAIAAINGGRIFRFLTKPCPPPVLVAAVEAAVEQHRLVTAERVLLTQTLRGSIQMLTDVLALADPDTFGQVVRIQRSARELAAKVPGAQGWPIEVAAMLSQVGRIALAPATVEKLQQGKPLTPEEQKGIDRLPAVASQLIANIPRLDEVRAALKYQSAHFDGVGAQPGTARGRDLPLGARVLAIVCDFDQLESASMPRQVALDTMRGRRGRYDMELLELFAANLGTQGPDMEIAEVAIHNVRVGMTFLQDVRSKAGALLVARGNEATAGLVERFKNFAPGSVQEPIRVSLRRAPKVA